MTRRSTTSPKPATILAAELSDDIYPTAEKAAVHVVEVPPGATDRDIDIYTGDKL